MSTATPVITEDTARHVLWFCGRDGGMQPGSFMERRIETVDAADIVHAELLRLGFPELVTAMLTAKNDIGGVEQLQKVDGCGVIAFNPPTGVLLGSFTPETPEWDKARAGLCITATEIPDCWKEGRR